MGETPQATVQLATVIEVQRETIAELQHRLTLTTAALREAQQRVAQQPSAPAPAPSAVIADA